MIHVDSKPQERIQFVWKNELPPRVNAGERAKQIGQELSYLRAHTVDQLFRESQYVYDQPVRMSVKFKPLKPILNPIAGAIRIRTALELKSEIPSREIAQHVAKGLVELIDAIHNVALLEKSPVASQLDGIVKGAINRWGERMIREDHYAPIYGMPTVVGDPTKDSFLEQFTQAMSAREVTELAKKVLPQYGDKIAEIGDKLAEFKLGSTYVKKFLGNYLDAYVAAFWQVNHPQDVNSVIDKIAQAQSKEGQQNRRGKSRRTKAA